MTDPLPSPLKHAGRRAFLRAAVLGAAVLPLAACVGDEDSLAKQAREGNNKNYIAGDGSVEEYGPGSRTAPVEISAVAYDGTAIDSATWVGQATVLNFWYAACTPGNARESTAGWSGARPCCRWDPWSPAPPGSALRAPGR